VRQVKAYQLALFGRWPITVWWISFAATNSFKARLIVSAEFQPRPAK
jgi:hypothetical protein